MKIPQDLKRNIIKVLDQFQQEEKDLTLEGIDKESIVNYVLRTKNGFRAELPYHSLLGIYQTHPLKETQNLCSKKCTEKKVGFLDSFFNQCEKEDCLVKQKPLDNRDKIFIK